MKKLMKCITLIVFLLCVTFAILSRVSDAGIWMSMMITFFTITYHLAMRLAVGAVFNKTINNQIDYNRKWFKVSDTEKRFYDAVKVKKWKDKMPTYDPDLFSPKKHTWEEIVQAMCQAELVHETIVVLSFLPVVMIIWWGSPGVFVITSLCAALLDLSFVMMQRYNRPRVLRLAKRAK